ncbi:hypothetical protein Tco_0771758 [Tanacetum coccineum]|uniref:Uncharacterized protein n=1 Tax=Tanacetum coccineum TaxID=301880 RepID=A0ABQ4ZIW2_9ASTR
MTSSSSRRGKAKTTQPWTTVKEITLYMGGTIRGYDVIVIKWKNWIRLKVAAFSVVYDSVQRMDENRSSDLVLFENTLAEFQTGYGHPFTMEAC